MKNMTASILTAIAAGLLLIPGSALADDDTDHTTIDDPSTDLVVLGDAALDQPTLDAVLTNAISPPPAITCQLAQTLFDMVDENNRSECNYVVTFKNGDAWYDAMYCDGPNSKTPYSLVYLSSCTFNEN